MSLKKRTRDELENQIEELEDLIAQKGVGSDYLSKAERMQRDLNLALILGGIASVLGITAWSLYKFKDN
ncbi:MAG: hypothetical protein WEA58_14190 [Balneolaceae bacterium]